MKWATAASSLEFDKINKPFLYSSQVENYENNQTNVVHGPFHEEDNNKFVSGASLAAAMAMTPFSLYRSRNNSSASPDTIREAPFIYDVRKIYSFWQD